MNKRTQTLVNKLQSILLQASEEDRILTPAESNRFESARCQLAELLGVSEHEIENMLDSEVLH